MLHHPGDPLLAGGLGGEDDVALVLAALVVGDDDRLAGSQRVEGDGDVGETHACAPSVCVRSVLGVLGGPFHREQPLDVPGEDVGLEVDARRRPSCAPRVVAARVSGMSETSNHCCGSAGVADRAHRERDAVDRDRALAGDERAQLGGEARGARTRQAAPSSIESIVGGAVDVALHDVAAEAVADGRGALEVDGVADRSLPSVLAAMDSAMTSAVNQSAPWSTTVRQTPETEIESPCRASDAASGPRTVRRAASPLVLPGGDARRALR